MVSGKMNVYDQQRIKYYNNNNIILSGAESKSDFQNGQYYQLFLNGPQASLSLKHVKLESRIPNEEMAESKK